MENLRKYHYHHDNNQICVHNAVPNSEPFWVSVLYSNVTYTQINTAQVPGRLNKGSLKGPLR